MTWTTVPERLQAAGISWRVYTQSHDSPLAQFAQYRQARPGSPLYDNLSIGPDLVSTFADDVAGGRLAEVSWILASAPRTWARTVFLLSYDENDGLFDHVPPPTPPAGTAGEYLTVDPLPADAHGITGPIGLGFRVPMLVISPWTAGGWACGNIFDHASTTRFRERRFGIHEPNISAWRRRVCGDLTPGPAAGRPGPPPGPAAQSRLPGRAAGAGSGGPARARPARCPDRATSGTAWRAPGPPEGRGQPAGDRARTAGGGDRPARQRAPAAGTSRPGTGTGTGGPGALRHRPATPAALTGVPLSLNAPAGWVSSGSGRPGAAGQRQAGSRRG